MSESHVTELAETDRPTPAEHMHPDSALTPAQKRHAQKNFLLANLFGPISSSIVAGHYMMLFASDVLHFDPLRIATLFALVPLVSILRIPLVPQVRRVGRIRAFLIGRGVQLLVVALLLLLPSRLLTFVALTGLIMIYLAARELGITLVWSSLARDLAGEGERGRFLALIHVSFTAATLIISGAIIVLVGDSLTELQYKVLLGIALLGIGNSCFWMRRLPDERERGENIPDQATLRRRSIFYILRHSPLLRLPLAISLMTIFAGLPLAVVYFRQVLHVPANLVAIYLFTLSLGQVFFLYLWGRLADTLGFRPMLLGLLSLTAVTIPIIFLIPPFPETGFQWHTVDPTTLMGIGSLLLLGLSNGILLPGIGIVATAIQQYHMRSEDGLEALNLFTILNVGFQSLVVFAAGAFIESVVIPVGTISIWNGLIHFDGYKAYAAVFAPLVLLISIPLTRRLPNVRPWFGVGDFFAALFYNPARTILAGQRLYDQAQDRRAELAHWFGVSANPMSIDPLIQLLRDPSFDVKIEAIRSLARTGSALAGQELSAILADEEHRSVWDHSAWALGELKHRPAFDLLVIRLSPEMPPRIRAMSARALGKLQDRRAIDPLVKVLEEEDQSLAVVSATCLALLQMDAREHAPLVFDALLKLRSREDRYELMNMLCEWLDISNRWLLQTTSAQSSWQSLRDYLEFHSHSWRTKRQSIIDAFLGQDHRAIVGMITAKLSHPGANRYPSAEALARASAQSHDWSPLSVLATAWLLYTE